MTDILHKQIPIIEGELSASLYKNGSVEFIRHYDVTEDFPWLTIQQLVFIIQEWQKTFGNIPFPVNFKDWRGIQG